MFKEVEDLALLGQSVLENNHLRKEFNSGFLTLGCLAAFDYIVKKQDISLSEEALRGVYAFLEIGKVVNNFHDDKVLDKDGYIKLRRKLSDAGLDAGNMGFFIRSVKVLENSRPNPWEGVDSNSDLDLKKYREKVNLVYWSTAYVASGLGSFSDVMNNDFEYSEDCPRWFKGMHKCLVSLQVVDDKIGWKGDLRNHRPSFFTGFCPNECLDLSPETFPLDERKKIFRELDAEFASYHNESDLLLGESGKSLLLAVRTLHSLSNQQNIVFSPRWMSFQKLIGAEVVVNSRHFTE